MWSVFVNTSGEWKLGGLDYVGNAQENPGFAIKIIPALELYDPPEKNDPSKQKCITKWLVQFIINQKQQLNQWHNFSSSDMWGLGCLIWEAFNGPLQQQSSLKILEHVRVQQNKTN